MTVPDNVYIVRTHLYKQVQIGALNGFHIEETVVFVR